MSLNYRLKRVLRPYFQTGRLRQFLDRARGLTMTPLTHEEVARLVGRPDPTIVEIGCNDGSDTLAFLEAMPTARVYCFEPDPRAILRFKQKLGSRVDRVTLSEIAISDRNGTITFHMSGSGPVPGEGFDQSGSIRIPKNHLLDHPWVTFDKAITVKTRTLDDWCAEHAVANIDFLWMDVQGAEGDVIAGAIDSLKRTRFLYTEYSNNELYEGQLPLRRLLALLPSFEVMRRYPGDVLLRNRSLRRN